MKKLILINQTGMNCKWIIFFHFVLSFCLTVQQTHAQQLLDDFNRSNSNTVGNSWIESESSSSTISINSNRVVLGTDDDEDEEYLYRDCSSLYNTTLSGNSYVMTWMANIRQSRSDPSGFDGGNYGVAFVLGASGTNFTNTTGYAVLYGQGGNTDPLRLVRFSNGLDQNNNITNIISGTGTDIGSEYLTIKVTYNPSNNNWSLFYASSTSAFISPLTASYTQIGSATVNNTYTGSNLRYVGCYYNHDDGSSENAYFDNVYVPSEIFITTHPVASQNICIGSDVSFSAAATGTPTVSVKWQKLIGSTWTDISGATTTTYTITNVQSTNAGQYRAVFTNSFGSVTSSVAVLSVDPVSVGGTVNSDASVCSGSNSGVLNLSSYTGSIVRWESSDDGGNNWTPISNTTNSQSYSGLTSSIQYRAVVQSGGCPVTVSSVANITIFPTPTLFSVTGGGSSCGSGSGVAVGLDNSEADVDYQLMNGASPVGSPVAGTGSPLTFGNQNISGTYTVVATHLAYGCTQTMTGSAVINNFNSPTVTASSSASILCGGTSAILSSTASSNSYLTPQTFSATVNASIPNNSSTGISSTINVTGAPLLMSQVTNISVTINASHNDDDELEVYLIRPGGTITNSSNGNFFNTIVAGQSICLVADRGGSGNNFTNTVFSDAAANPISSGSAPFSSTYRPENPFSSLNGNPNGLWTLKMLDDNNSNNSSRTFLNWSITLNTLDGLTFTWTSSPPGFVSNLSNPGSVYPLVNTTYSVLVTNPLSGCTASSDVDLTVHPAVNVNATVVSHGCNGLNNGIINVDATGGTPPLTGDGLMTNLSPGPYTFTVTDSYGCSSSQTVSIVEPSVLASAANVVSDVTCFGLSNGVVSVTATGGTSPYSGDGVVNGLAPGNHGFLVTDANGCTTNTSATINEPTQLTSTAVVANNVSCIGANDGAFNVSATGGTPPYSGTGLQTGYNAGSHLITVTDNNGCISTTSSSVAVVDIIPPVINCPSNISMNADPGDCGAVVNFSVTASDNCAGTIVHSVPASGSFFPVGTTTVESTAIDAMGNSSTCSFTVSINDVEPPAINCPLNITVNSDPGSCSAIVNFTVNGLDNCSGISIVSVPPSGSVFPLGTTTVNSTATDNNGNTSSCSFLITVIDNEQPLINCPSNITAYADPGECNAVVYFSVTGSDNCFLSSVVSIPASGSVFPLGTTTVNSTATDANGNVSTCSFTVTVTDNESPVIICPSNISVNSNPGVCGATVNFSVTATDNCSVSVVSVPASGSVFPVGTTTVNSTATDANGNISTCSFTVTVTDNESPVITCPSNISVNSNPGVCGATVNFSVTATDNCAVSVVSAPASGSVFPIGTTTVNSTATDANGNISTCSFTVTVTDNESPIITCPSNISVNSDPGVCGAIVNFSVTATDNCAVSVVSVPASGSLFPIGTTTVNSTATDANGNTSTCSFTVTVTDNESPVITCPANISVNSNPGFCSATVNFSVTATDNCSVSIVSVPASGSVFPVGTTTVNSTATDANGNVSTCSFTVTVTDNESPVITCPSNISVNSNPGVCGATVNFSVTATDNCSVNVVSVPASGTVFPVGTTTVNSTATDANGNISTCSFTVTVTDNESPVITCPSNISVNSNPGVCGATVNFSVTATDNCAVSVVSVPASGSLFPIGTTTVNSTATDANGNTSTCSFTVTVTDNESPVISCPANISVNSNPGFCGATVNFSVTVTDNCAVSVVSVPASGSLFPIGTTTVNSTATDANGNTSTCSFTVTVTDNESPVITCPANISVNSNPGFCSATVNFSVTATDNCSVSVVSVPASGSVFPIGTTTVNSTATDANGNISTCSFTVTVTDNESPVITCPSNISVNSNPGVCGATINFSVTATDNCSVSVVSVPASGSVFPVGTTTVNSTATDSNGNVSTCSFTVTVTDNESPVITCPSNISVNSNSGVCGATVNFSVTATDNCAVSVVSVPASGSVFPIGTTTVNSTATDANGNISTCSFTVTVTDNESPIITCPSNISVNSDPGVCGATVNFSVTATDNCAVGVVSVPASGSVFPVGTTTVNSTATDINGNVSTCSFTVTVSDTELPVISAPSGVTVNTDPGVNGATVYYSVTASDNCSASVTSVPASGSLLPVGITTVQTTATDIHGNISSNAFTVHVIDNELPVITCPSNIVVNTDPAICGAIVSFNVSATDNASVNVVSIPASGSVFPVGTTTVNSVATDESGNITSCSFTVTVNDAELPVINCPSNILVNSDAHDCGAKVVFSVTATDNCSASVVSLPASGSEFPIGTTTVISTATDPAGNVSTCSFTITVVDAEIPVINCPANIAVNADPGQCGAIVNYTVTATDNCNTGIVSSPVSGTLFPIGITTVQSTVTDASGNVSICSFTVTVSDNEPPVVNCPANISKTTDPGQCGAIVNFNVGVTDNCTASVLSVPASGSFFPVGTTVVQTTATDASGNTATCTFDVTITDGERPAVLYPSNMTVNAEPGQCGATVNFSVGATDNCSANVTAVPASGSFFPTGVNNVSVTATDAAGNTRTRNFTVTVIDNEKPVINNCPGDITVSVYRTCDTLISWVAPTVTDNCNANMVSNYSSGHLFSVGISTVTYTATDAQGNTSVCSFTVTVLDNSPPVLTNCPNDIVVGATGPANVNWTEPAVSDNCNYTLSSNYHSGDIFPFGLTTIVYTVTDGSSNNSTCSFTVTVTNTTSIEQFDQDVFVNVFPNPFTNEFVLSIKGGKNNFFNYRLLGIDGKEIISGNSANGSVLLNTQELAAAVYILEVNMPGHSAIKKRLIKN